MELTKADRASIALNNKIQIELMMALMKKASRDADKTELLEGYETKLATLEKEITSKNELLKKLPEQRIKDRKEMSLTLNRLERVSKFNYIKEEGRFYKLLPMAPRDVIEGTYNKDNSNPDDIYTESTGSVDYTNVRISREPRRIEIEEDVYKAAEYEQQELKLLLKEQQNKYKQTVANEAALIKKYGDNKGKGGQKDLQFKADLLTEQLANDDIFLDMYINNREDYDGVVYNEDQQKYQPVKYDDYVTSLPLRDVGNLNKTVFQLGDTEGEIFGLAQKTQARDARKNTLSANSFWDQSGTDFTGKYIASGRKFMLAAKLPENARTLEGYAVDADPDMTFNTEMELYGSPSVKNPNYKTGRSVNPLANTQRDMQNQIRPIINTQRDMQNQIRPRLQRKNQNMNPSGFNMKNFLSKKPK